MYFHCHKTYKHENEQARLPEMSHYTGFPVGNDSFSIGGYICFIYNLQENYPEFFLLID